MPEYELCLQAENSSNGARLLLRSCAQEELQRWELQDAGQIVLVDFLRGVLPSLMDREEMQVAHNT